MMKFSQAISQVKWLSGEKTNISKTISVLVFRVQSGYVSVFSMYDQNDTSRRENFSIHWHKNMQTTKSLKRNWNMS
jgi:hypothetical protein